MRLYPLAGQPLAFGYLFASHPHIRAGLVSGGHAKPTDSCLSAALNLTSFQQINALATIKDLDPSRLTIRRSSKDIYRVSGPTIR